MLYANRSALTTDELKTVVSPSASEWSMSSVPGGRRLEDVVAGPAHVAGRLRDVGRHVPAEERVVGAQLVVDPRDRLVLVSSLGRPTL